MTHVTHHGERPSRAWIIWCGGVLTVVMAVFVLSWWKLPAWYPAWVAEYSPWPEPALRAMQLDTADDSYTRVENRLTDWGPAIGPALRRKFEFGDHDQRLHLLALATELASRDGIAPGTVFPPEKGRRFTTEGVAIVREDLYQLVVVAMADGSSYLPNNAAYLSARLHDPRVVMVFCDYLRGKKPPIFEDLEPVVNVLGSMADARAVPFLLPLLPIRHRPHPVVDDALDRCLNEMSLVHVIAATRHPHEVIRTWAARHFPRYRTSAELAQRLVALLDDGERQVRVAAVQGLAEGDYQAVGPRLIEFAQHEEDLPVRIAAVEALGDLGYAPAAPCLRTLVTTAQDRLRNEAIIALGDLADAESFAILLPLLEHVDKTVALKAHWSLSQLPLTPEQLRAVDAIWPLVSSPGVTPFVEDPTLRPSPAPP